MNTVLVLGLLLNLVALPIVARRLWFLFRLIRHGQPAPDRVAESPAGSAAPSRPRSSRSWVSAGCCSGRCRGSRTSSRSGRS
ncbi:MAG: hypothetical protein R2731_10415 [Nocardioides sp.]